VVVFKLGEEKYGVPIESVREIIPPSDITPVPGAPSFFEGILNVRGELVSVISMRRFVGMEDFGEDVPGKILIISATDGTVQGLLTDEVSSIVDIPSEGIQPLDDSADQLGFSKGLLKGVAETSEGLVVIVDVEKMLTESLNSEETVQ
jgi:purine-binding chemotaxis protein CheW